MLRAVTRGRFKQVAGPGGRPVDVALYGCQVAKAPHHKDGKAYMTLDVSGCTGDVDAMRRVDEFVKKQADPAFSPLLSETLIVKIPHSGVIYEDALGNPLGNAPGRPPQLLTNARVDVVVRPGAFGPFGYCWLLQRCKPGAVA